MDEIKELRERIDALYQKATPGLLLPLAFHESEHGMDYSAGYGLLDADGSPAHVHITLAAVAEYVAALVNAWPQIRQSLTSTAGEKDAERYGLLRDTPATITFDQAVTFRTNGGQAINVTMIGNTELDAALDAIASSSKDDQAGEQAPSDSRGEVGPAA